MSVQIIKKNLASLCQVIDDIQKVPLLWDQSFFRYQDYCLAVPEFIASGKIRVAVVGAIKSGKSTFINSMFKKELVKRGAGVRTSITTRISKGKKNMAHLTFASWDEINQSIGKSLLSFPEELIPPSPEVNFHHFDLRREKDRSFLVKVQETINCQFPITNKGIPPEAMIISHALEGYESCKDFVKADRASVFFESRNLGKHTKFTSDPNNAFYVSEAKIQVYAPSMPNYLEIADCQGTDSTDPAQFDKIMRYIESANLMIYCISSRHGLRRADMDFLSIIREWGLMSNIVFCINCDISEHSDINDLQYIIEKTCKDLQYFIPNPSVFTFSFLYDLFEHLGSKLTPQDQLRYDLWKKENDITPFCIKNNSEFHEFFNAHIEQKRSELLVSNHVQRIHLIIKEINKRANQVLEMLKGDKNTQKRLYQQFNEKKERIKYLSSLADASVAAAVLELKKKIKIELQNFFIQDANSIFRKTASVINQADLFEIFMDDDVNEAASRLSYKMFQELRHILDQHMAKKSLPAIKVRIEEQEQSLYEWLDIVMGSFAINHEEDFEDEIIDIPKVYDDVHDQIQNMETILGIKLPWPAFICTYDRKIQIRVFGGMGIEGILDIFARIINKDKKRSINPWLKRVEKEIKYKCLIQLRQQMESYLQDLWVNYYSPLISGLSRDMAKQIHDRFEKYESVSQNLEKLMLLEENKKKEQIEKIYEIQHLLQTISNSLVGVQKAIY